MFAAKTTAASRPPPLPLPLQQQSPSNDSVYLSTIKHTPLLLRTFLFAPPPRHPLNLLFRRISSDGEKLNEVPLFSVRKNGGKLKYDVWSSSDAEFFYGCSNASRKFAKADAITHKNRYLMIATSEGLNQQRTGIIDAVVAARILNATLVVPKLDQRSYWKDASNFECIFDVDLFISTLGYDVNILKELPQGPKVTTMHVQRKCNERCYEKRVLPVIMKRLFGLQNLTTGFQSVGDRSSKAEV